MEERKKKILELIDEAHHTIESFHQELRILKGSEGKLERQRFLLADMACHLVQDAIEKEEMDIESLKNRLFSILTVCDEFLPEKDLKIKANEIIA